MTATKADVGFWACVVMIADADSVLGAIIPTLLGIFLFLVIWHQKDARGPG